MFYCFYRTLKNEDFNKISDEIIKFFSQKSKEAYFMPPISKKNSKEGKPVFQEEKNVNDIIQKWPILTASFGYVLVIKHIHYNARVHTHTHSHTHPT